MHGSREYSGLSDIGRSPTLIGILVGVGWFLIYLAAQIVLFQLFDLRQRFGAMVALLISCIGLAVLTTTVVAHTNSLDGAVLSAFSSVVTMASLWVFYMPFYYVIATSLSVRTLLTLASRGDGALPLAQLEALFASSTMLEARLTTMVAYRNLAVRGTAFTVTTKGRITATVFGGLKRLWRLGPGG